MPTRHDNNNASDPSSTDTLAHDAPMPTSGDPLPLSGATSLGVDPDAAPAPPARRILVVDDNVDAADILAGILESWGYETVVAHDGPAALAALQDFVPDIALLDIGMPAMDGYELAAHLRFQPGCEEMTIVAITGSGDPEAARRSRAKGFAAHLVKPVDPASLAQWMPPALAGARCAPRASSATGPSERAPAFP